MAEKSQDVTVYDENSSNYIAVDANGRITTNSYVKLFPFVAGSDILNSFYDAMVIDTSGFSVLYLHVTGTWSGIIQAYGSVNGSQLLSIPIFSSESQVTNINASGGYYINCAGLKNVQLLMSTYSSGSATVYWNTTQGNKGIEIIPKEKNVIYKSVNLLNGVSNSMNVNGSGTPVRFSFVPSSSEKWYLSEITIVLLDDGTMDPTDFGAISTLTNGITLMIQKNSISYEITRIHNNIELISSFFAGGNPTSAVTSGGAFGFLNTQDAYIGRIIFENPILLNGSRSDSVYISINDNLTAIDYLIASAKLYRYV